MVDNNIKFLDKNLMRLAIELVKWMELEMIELNKSAKFQGSIAEIKLFNAIRGEEKSISELARLMNISRQAVHKTAHKLEDLGFLELSTRHDNKKDRVVKITELGQEIRKQGAEHIMVIEEKLAWSIGERNLEFIRVILAGHSKKLKACD
jgi:DNA-binding MarR family transcriptional regulator